MDRGITVLSETPAALDIEALKKLYGYYKAGKSRLLQNSTGNIHPIRQHLD